jgi:radical SAM modification target selenobiotic family peptide
VQVISSPGAVYFLAERRGIVEEKHLKKLLAGLCIGGLVASASLIPVNSSGQGSSS